jgi:hypothetical protein
MEYKYDVTFSFAGEDREYVEQVAKILESNDVKLFYDKFEEADLWGKDLGLHFDTVYRKSAKYCIPFISASYKNRIWTNYEIRTAIARAIESNEEYILPARFDDTEIEGIRPTIGYINLKDYSPEKFAELILKKLEKETTKPITEVFQETKGKIDLGIFMISYDMRGVQGVSLKVAITNTEKEYRYFKEPYFRLSKPFMGNADTFYLTDRMEIINLPVKLEYGQVIEMTYPLKLRSEKEIWRMLDGEATVHAVVTTTLGEKYNSNELSVAKVFEAFDMTKKR